MRIRGIDVSKWQGVIDWAKVAKDDVHFAIIRVGNRGLTSGSISTDPYFEKNIKGAIAVGLKVGVYFYSCSINTKEAEEEARFVISKIKDYDVQMPVVFDFEGFGDSGNRNYGMTKERITDNCIAFQNIIKASGYTCMLYGSQAYMLSDGTLWEVQTALYFRWTCLSDGAVPELAAGFGRNDRRLS